MYLSPRWVFIWKLHDSHYFAVGRTTLGKLGSNFWSLCTDEKTETRINASESRFVQLSHSHSHRKQLLTKRKLWCDFSSHIGSILFHRTVSQRATLCTNPQSTFQRIHQCSWKFGTFQVHSIYAQMVEFVRWNIDFMKRSTFWHMLKHMQVNWLCICKLQATAVGRWMSFHLMWILCLFA